MSATRINVPEGYIPLQMHNGVLVYAACFDHGPFHGWLMYLPPNGQWVSKRKLEPWEIMQAEDQEHYGIVQQTSGPKLGPKLVDSTGGEGP